MGENPPPLGGDFSNYLKLEIMGTLNEIDYNESLYDATLGAINNGQGVMCANEIGFAFKIEGEMKEGYTNGEWLEERLNEAFPSAERVQVEDVTICLDASEKEEGCEYYAAVITIWKSGIDGN